MSISLSDNPLLTQDSYPMSPWPLYGRKYESLNSRHNFFMQGFKPGIPLQAAELNSGTSLFKSIFKFEFFYTMESL
jgi:hypothetical protein